MRHSMRHSMRHRFQQGGQLRCWTACRTRGSCRSLLEIRTSTIRQAGGVRDHACGNTCMSAHALVKPGGRGVNTVWPVCVSVRVKQGSAGRSISWKHQLLTSQICGCQMIFCGTQSAERSQAAMGQLVPTWPRCTCHAGSFLCTHRHEARMQRQLCMWCMQAVACWSSVSCAHKCVCSLVPALWWSLCHCLWQALPECGTFERCCARECPVC